MNKKIRVDIYDESRPEGDQLICFFSAADFKNYTELAAALRQELGGLSSKARTKEARG